MSLDVNAAMDGIGVRLATITGLRVFDYTPDDASPPAAVIQLPSVTYDSTMARGADEATFPVHVLVGKASDRASRHALAPYLAGTGAASVKQVIEADRTLAGAVSSTRVERASVSVIPLPSGIDLLAATFDVHVIA